MKKNKKEINIPYDIYSIYKFKEEDICANENKNDSKLRATLDSLAVGYFIDEGVYDELDNKKYPYYNSIKEAYLKYEEGKLKEDEKFAYGFLPFIRMFPDAQAKIENKRGIIKKYADANKEEIKDIVNEDEKIGYAFTFNRKDK